MNVACTVCGNETPRGRHGSPKLYCSSSCAWKARNERRRAREGRVLRLVKDGKPTPAKPPTDPCLTDLKPAARAWLESVLSQWNIGDDARELTKAAAVALSRAIEARAVLDREGLSYTTKGGIPRANPMIVVERESMNLDARILRQLNLEGE